MAFPSICQRLRRLCGNEPLSDGACSRRKDDIKDTCHLYVDLDKNGDQSLQNDSRFAGGVGAKLRTRYLSRKAPGLMFHSGGGEPMDMDKLGQRIVRPAVEAIRLEWYGWHGFSGIASNLYELGANEKIVQRVLRHAKPQVTKERYIKIFDPAAWPG